MLLLNNLNPSESSLSFHLSFKAQREKTTGGNSHYSKYDLLFVIQYGKKVCACVDNI